MAPRYDGRAEGPQAGQRRARLATRPPPEDTEALKRTAAASGRWSRKFRRACSAASSSSSAWRASRHLSTPERSRTASTGQAAVTIAKHYGATVIATASPGKHKTVLALGANHVLDSRGGDIAAEVLRLTGGVGVDVVLEATPGATF